MDQKILCIQSNNLFTVDNPKWNGLKTDNLEQLYQLLTNKSEFRVRGELEEDSNYKQIIPQVVLKFGNKYFLHKQVDATESRLNSLCPLPLGGHVEEFDSTSEDIIRAALLRELEEEVTMDANIVKESFLGLIYIEDENIVNHMHVGLAYIFEIDSNKVKMNEEGLEAIGFVDVEYLKSHLNELNYWSRVIVDYL